MDPAEDGPMARVERTFWTFWNYITETVNRILRPEPPVTEINDTNPTQDNHEHLDTKDDTAPKEEDEKHRVPALSDSPLRPAVPWDSGSELQSEITQHTVEGEIDETGIDVANLPATINTTVEDESSLMREDAGELITTTLVNSPYEIINESAQNSCTREESGEHQSIDVVNEIDGGECIKHTDLVVEPEDACKINTTPIEKEHSEEDEGKMQIHYTDLEVDAPIQSGSNEKEREEESETPENMTTKNTACDIEDEDQDNTSELHLGTVHSEVTEQDSFAVEVVERASEMSEIDRDDAHELVTSLLLETDNMTTQADATLFQQSVNNECREEENMQSDDTVVRPSNEGMEENPSLMSSNILPHAASSTPDNSFVDLLKSERVEQSVRSENDEEESKRKTEDGESPEEHDNIMRKSYIEDECQDYTNEIALNVENELTKQDSCFTVMADTDQSNKEIKNMDKDDLKTLPTPLVVDTDILDIQPVRNERWEAQVTDDSEGETITDKEEHSAAVRNEGSVNEEKRSKLDEVILVEEIGIARESHNNTTNNDLCSEAIFYTPDRTDIEVSSEDSFMGKNSITVKHEGVSTQEEGKAFKNIPPGECGGQDLEQLYSYKESRGEVPGHNNEPDIGSATQRFLEEGNCRENQTTLLQEEEESGAAKCLQNSGSSEGVDRFEDPMETEADNERFEEHSIGPEQKTRAENLMKAVDAYKDFEIDLVLKEEATEIEFQMEDSFCDSVADAGAMQEIETANVAGFTQNNFNDNEFQDFSINDPSTFETECDFETVHSIVVKDTKEGLNVLQGEAPNTKMNESYSEEEQLEAAGEDSAKVSSIADELTDVADHEISTSMLSGKNQEQLICSNVIEEEILDLWIKQTSVDNSEVKAEDQEEDKLGSMPELGKACDVNVSLSTAESGLFDQFLDMGGSHMYNKQELPKIEQLITTSSELHKSYEDQNTFSITEPLLETPHTEDFLRKSLLCTTPESTEDESDTSDSSDLAVSRSSPVTHCEFTIQTNDEPVTRLRTVFELDALDNIQLYSPNEIENSMFVPDTPTEGCLSFQEMPNVECLQEPRGDEETYRVDVRELDFTVQKSRIAVKNPKVRPPKDPRSLLHKPSLEPSPSPSPSKYQPPYPPAGVPLGVMGIGVKLPGFGAGFPVLKKTKKMVQDETEITTEETKPVEDDDDKFMPEDSPPRPKWMPPNHPSFGNPLMSELRSKLKKTAKE